MTGGIIDTLVQVSGLDSATLLRAIVERISHEPRLVAWSWDTIVGLGKSRVVKSSYFFLFAVPILARVLSSAPESINIPTWGQSITIEIGLPFNWTLMFAAAAAASAGNILYTTACPEVVKRYKSYADFKESDRDGRYLHAEVEDLISGNRLSLDIAETRAALPGSSVEPGEFAQAHVYTGQPPAWMQLSKNLLTLGKAYTTTLANYDKIAKELCSSQTPSPSSFYFVRDVANMPSPLTRLVTTGAFSISFFVVFIIFIQNCMYIFDVVL